MPSPSQQCARYSAAPKQAAAFLARSHGFLSDLLVHLTIAISQVLGVQVLARTLSSNLSLLHFYTICRRYSCSRTLTSHPPLYIWLLYAVRLLPSLHVSSATSTFCIFRSPVSMLTLRALLTFLFSSPVSKTCL